MKLKLDPILKNNVRILRPIEFKAILNEIKKPHHRVMLQTLMFTGMRYIEVKRLKEHPRWFDGNFIKICFGKGIKKQQIRNKERWVRLNNLGKMVVPYYLDLLKPLPTNQTWRENMRRWGEAADLDPVGLCPKTTRKTWESWLVYFYPGRLLNIIQSQGHTSEIAMEHYLNCPFTETDVLQMKEYVSGWINNKDNGN